MQADGSIRGNFVFIYVYICNAGIVYFYYMYMCMCVYVYKYVCTYAKSSMVTETIKELISVQPNLASRQCEIAKLPFDSVTYRENINDLYHWAP